MACTDRSRFEETGKHSEQIVGKKLRGDSSIRSFFLSNDSTSFSAFPPVLGVCFLKRCLALCWLTQLCTVALHVIPRTAVAPLRVVCGAIPLTFFFLFAVGGSSRR
jgi:hypothetical protein